MVEKGEPNEEVWSPMARHEEFLKLCALSTAGGLTAEERKKLDGHLAGCPECREALKQFEAVVDHGIPALAPNLAPEPPPEDPSFSQEAAETSFYKRLSEEEEKSRIQEPDVEPWLPPRVVRRDRGFRRSFDRYHFWMPLAAGLILCLSLSILTYRMGMNRRSDAARSEPKNVTSPFEVQRNSLEAVRQELAVVHTQLTDRDRAIGDLRLEIARKSAEIAQLKASQSEQLSALEKAGENNRQLTQERDLTALQVQQNQETLEASEKRLKGFERERSEDVIHASTLEAKLDQVTRSLADERRKTDELQELLAKDDDIRELMGSQDLYITEVRDVLTTGDTRRAYGRVFYMKGKSLIFYAYDLNGLPGRKPASTFQAWGNRGPDRSQALRLGTFHEDSASRKRWVMKYNDKNTLSQIDAVFVTIEPTGGSNKPSGMPLMYAYLKVNANHP